MNGRVEPLAELVRTLPGLRAVAWHDALDGVEARLVLRGATRAAPPLATIDVALAALGVTDRIFIGVGAGSAWLEVALDGPPHEVLAQLVERALAARDLHTPRLPYVDVCLLAPTFDTALVARASGGPAMLHVLSDLQARRRARLAAGEAARARDREAWRSRLETVAGLRAHDVTPADGELPSGLALAKALDDPFARPGLRTNNEAPHAAHARWLTDALAATVFAAPAACYCWPGGAHGGPWWRLELAARAGWAADVLYTIAGVRASDGWAPHLHWSVRALFLSRDAATVMAWEVSEHHLHVRVLATADVLVGTRAVTGDSGLGID